MATRKKTSFPKHKINILLLENISAVAIKQLKDDGFNVVCEKGALTEEELKVRIKGVHALGIRSKTRVTDTVLREADRLLCVGCFCIGTDQVDLIAAEKHGVPIFNSPFSNSRSVAELIIGVIISLARKLGDRNKEMHSRIWTKSAVGCNEVRGKTLGIVGYGHIGSQLSVLAEAMGMKVIYYDVVTIMPLGNSKPCDCLETLLKEADFVTLHVPKTPQTENMITAKEIALMKPHSYLLNASRGSVVDLEALAAATKSGHLAGAYVDVYPTEPETNVNDWENVLQNCPNTIITPHIGGSTEEAQTAIGHELADKIIKYINTGCTLGAVNFPSIDLPYDENTHRILNIHKNVPGVLKNINNILSPFNVSGQILGTKQHTGYLIVDVDKEASKEIKHEIEQLSSSIKTRILY